MAITSFPDTGDNLDQTNLRELLKAASFGGKYVLYGMNMTDGGSLELDVSAGAAVVVDRVVQLDATEALSLTASTTNYVYLEPDGTFTVNTTGTAPSADAFYMCNVVTGTSTVTSINPSLQVDSGRQRFAWKATQEDVTSSTTLQDDDELTVDLTHGVWRIDLFLGLDADPAGIDFDFNITGGTGSYSGHWHYWLSNASGSSFAAGDFAEGSGPAQESATASVGRISGILQTVEDITVTFEWAQNSSNASATSVLVGSAMLARRVG